MHGVMPPKWKYIAQSLLSPMFPYYHTKSDSLVIKPFYKRSMKFIVHIFEVYKFITFDA